VHFAASLTCVLQRAVGLAFATVAKVMMHANALVVIPKCSFRMTRLFHTLHAASRQLVRIVLVIAIMMMMMAICCINIISTSHDRSIDRIERESRISVVF
jgi:hypothetical protein